MIRINERFLVFAYCQAVKLSLFGFSVIMQKCNTSPGNAERQPIFYFSAQELQQ